MTTGVNNILECVVENDDGTYTARFGYETDYDGPVRVPYGSENKMTPAPFQGEQPEIFEPIANAPDGRPGRTPYDAGAFQITFDAGEQVVWNLLGSTETASQNTKRCPSKCLSSTFFETVDYDSGVVTVRVQDVEGFKGIGFVKPKTGVTDPDPTDPNNWEPYLNGFDASLVSSNGDFVDASTLSDAPSGLPSDLVWAADYDQSNPTLPSEVKFRLEATANEASYFAVAVNKCGTITFIDPPHAFEGRVADQLRLRGNYPNPFDDRTTIAFDLPRRAPVTLAIYDVMGRRIATLADKTMPAGVHEVAWSGAGEAGRTRSSGVYLIRLTAGEQTVTGRLVRIK